MRALDLQVGANVLQNRKASHLLLDQRSEAIKLVEVAGRQRVLIERPGRTDTEVQVLDWLEEHIEAGDGTDLAAQLLDDVIDRRTLIARLKLDETRAGVHPHP